MKTFEVTEECPMWVEATCFVCRKAPVCYKVNCDYYLIFAWCCSEACVNFFILQNE